MSDPLHVAEALADECFCGARCCSKFTLEKILNFRKTYWIDSRTDHILLLLLIQYLCNYYDVETQELLLQIYSIPVCPRAFMTLVGISSYTYNLVLQHVMDGTEPTHGNYFRIYDQMQATRARCWLTTFAHINGDHQPDSDEIHLPSKMTKADIYEAFTEDTKKIFPMMFHQPQHFILFGIAISTS